MGRGRVPGEAAWRLGADAGACLMPRGEGKVEGGLEEVQSGGIGRRDAGPEVEGEAHASPRSLLPGPVPWFPGISPGWVRVGFSCLTHV